MISNNRRFVLSFLGKGEHDLAISEEMLSDRDSGEILLKSKDIGDIISYDALARYNQHITTVENVCHTYGVTGEIYRLDDGDVFPRKVKIGTNILTEDIIIPNASGSLLISLDYDCYNISGNQISQNANPDMTVSITYTDVGGSKEISVPISEHRDTFITTESDITINSITISQNTNDDTRLIINSILLYITQ